MVSLPMLCILIITYLHRQCLGPIIGGALVYKVGFRWMAAVSCVFTFVLVSQFRYLHEILHVQQMTTLLLIVDIYHTSKGSMAC